MGIERKGKAPLFKDYSSRLIRCLEDLPQGSIVVFDIEGSVSISSEGKQVVRSDFQEVYRWLGEKRPDLEVSAITYRSQETGINNLESYGFQKVWFKEDILTEVGKPDKVEFLDRKIAEGSKPSRKFFLIDDSYEGLEAEKRGLGLKV